MPTSREALFGRGGCAFAVRGVRGAETTHWDLTIPDARLGPIRFTRQLCLQLEQGVTGLPVILERQGQRIETRFP